MIVGRALLVAAAAMFAAGCGALGFPEARAPLSLNRHAECPQQRAAAVASPPSSQLAAQLMP
jgi:hypothetical protein